MWPRDTRRTVNLETLAVAIIGIGFVYGLTYVAQRISRAAEVPIRIEVSDAQTQVTANDAVLFVRPSSVRYTVSRRWKRLRLARADDMSAQEHPFADPEGTFPPNLANAFIAECCVLARKSLGARPTRPLKVDLAVTLSEPHCRAAFIKDMKPDHLRVLAVRLVVSETEAEDKKIEASPS